VDSHLKLFFENLKNCHGNVTYTFEKSFTIFKIATTNFSWKFTMFQKSFYMFKALQKNMRTFGLFYIKSPFPLSNVHQLILIILWTLIHATKRDPSVQKIQKTKYIYHFRFQYLNVLLHYYSFEFVIIVQSKSIDLTII